MADTPVSGARVDASPTPASASCAPAASPAGAPTPAPREHFASRLGFILISAGCAIGLGNVWRFPYITGQYGGAAFILIYLLFLVVLGLPIMVMEFAVGRASQASAAGAYDRLVPSGRFHWFSWFSYAGCMLLMMFYTVVCGWMLDYVVKMATGQLSGLDAAGVAGAFSAMLADPGEVVGWMVVAIAIGLLVCSLGLQRGVERVTKWMMAALFVVMAVLAVRSVTLPGAEAGLRFYLVPDFDNLLTDASTGAFSWSHLGEAAYAAMGQAFFTLSLGISSMEIFGSRIGRDRSITGEAVRVAGLDTLVALVAGLIIFPACFAFGVDPGQGPGLVFVTLPGVFNQMPLGQVWGALFFVFMSFAALSSVIAVFENLISFQEEKFGITRRASVVRNGLLILVLSLPCALGYNVLSGVTLPNIGDIQSIEDFVLSNNMLPIGSLAYVVICVSARYGWGWRNFLAEADAGRGLKFPAWARAWVSVGIPALIVVILVMGYVGKFAG